MDAAQLTPEATASVVYILGADDLQVVKIGFSESMIGARQRLATAQTYCPASLSLLAAFPGTFQDERTIHAHFAQHRLKGEWFIWTEAIDAFIKKCQAAHGSPVLVRYALEASDLANRRHDWNPAKWTQLVSARGAKLIPLRVLLRRKPGRRIEMYYLHPVYPHRQMSKSSGTYDGHEAAAAAAVWQSQLHAEWQARGVQLPPSKKRATRPPMEANVKEYRSLKRKYRQLYAEHQAWIEKTGASA